MSTLIPFRRRPTLAAAAALAMLAMLAMPVAQAMKLRPQNLKDLIAESESIISGKVLRVTDGVTESGMPYTEITIHVADAAKGAIQEGNEYTFRQFGLLKPRKIAPGRVLVAVTPEGFPNWTAGEHVVAFLYQPAKLTGLQTTAGMAQGKLSFVGGGRVVNEFDNVGLFDGVDVDSGLLSTSEREMLDSTGPVDAATFMNLVGRAVRGGWVETGRMH